MKIGKYFTRQELERSDMAKRLGIQNIASPEIIENAKLLTANLLDPLREFWGPIHISSWYRCPNLNLAVKGSDKSHHMSGFAVDIDHDHIHPDENAEIFKVIKDNFEFNTLIWEFGNSKRPDWIHVSWLPNNNPKNVLIAFRVNGKVVYVKY
jgi:hypothetical protein